MFEATEARHISLGGKSNGVVNNASIEDSLNAPTASASAQTNNLCFQFNNSNTDNSNHAKENERKRIYSESSSDINSPRPKYLKTPVSTPAPASYEEDVNHCHTFINNSSLEQTIDGQNNRIVTGLSINGPVHFNMTSASDTNHHIVNELKELKERVTKIEKEIKGNRRRNSCQF